MGRYGGRGVFFSPWLERREGGVGSGDVCLPLDRARYTLLGMHGYAGIHSVRFCFWYVDPCTTTKIILD